MPQHLRLATLVIGSVLALGACASDAGSTTAPTSAPTSAPTTAPTIGTTTYPADGDVALVRIGRPGELPRLVIGGDGWVYVAAGTSASATTTTSGRTATVHGAAAIPPPAPPTALERRRLTPRGVGTVLALAERLGLLQTPGAYADPGVTDMESIEVSVGDGTSTYVHTAYALGFETETGNRKNLQDFVAAIDDLPSLVGSDLGEAEAYAPALYRVVDAVTFVRGNDEPSWPSGVPVARGCVTLPVAEFPAGVAGIYVAEVDGAPTRVAVIPHLPGDECR